MRKILISEVRSHCSYTNTKESRIPGIVACLHWVLLLSFSSHYYALLHFILINLKVRKNKIHEKQLTFGKFWGIFMYFQGSLDMVCKYQPHKLNKCELFKAVSPALLISAWLRNFAFCFYMAPQWTLSNNHDVTEGHTFVFFI